MIKRYLTITAVLLLAIQFLAANGRRDEKDFRDFNGPGYGYGMMGQGMMGSGMMGGYYGNEERTGKRLDMDSVEKEVAKYLKSYAGNGYKINEVMEFSRNFYVEVAKEGTDTLVQELLVDPWTGAIFPEYGPNMMWNLSSHMGGMMGGYALGGTDKAMSVTPAEAVDLANKYLDSNIPGLVASENPDKFNGYYTLHTLKDGKVTGMLSVNGFSGQVWYHNWHGEFLGMTEDKD